MKLVNVLALAYVTAGMIRDTEVNTSRMYLHKITSLKVSCHAQ